jgi:signal transduction histidine kinase
MGIARDITKRKKNEERLLEYQTQLKNLASKLSLTEERERRYIAEGLHDDIIQPLAFLDIKMDSLKKTIRDRDLIESCNEMQETIRELIKTSRAFTFDLSSPVLYELGLEAAIEEWLATNIRQKHKIETVFEDDGESKPLDNDMRASLFKAVKELLVNVVKHSKAGNVKVSVTRCEDKIQIRVEDNGVGFRPVEKKGLSGYGLFSIHERLDYFGGSFDIESEPEKGTRVTLTAPLKLDSISGKGANNEH